jgi:hypothetical protein
MAAATTGITVGTTAGTTVATTEFAATEFAAVDPFPASIPRTAAASA